MKGSSFFRLYRPRRSVATLSPLFDGHEMHIPGSPQGHLSSSPGALAAAAGFPGRGRVRAAAALLLAATSCFAQAEFPEHAIRLIVPFSPGGAVDGAARATTVELGKALAQSIVVDNRPGSGGTIGINAASRAAPDGYTLLLGNIALASAPALYPHSGINPKDFVPIALIGTTPYILTVRQDFPAKTLAELLSLVKAHPGKYNYASAGSGSAIHLAGELFKTRAGVDIVHVPYKGAAPAVTALLGGEVEMMFGSLMEMKPMIEAGKLRALAVTSSARSSLVPNIPTLNESGVPGYQVTGWYGLYTGAKVPPEELKKLRTAAANALHSEAMRKELVNYGMEAALGDAKEAGDLLNSEAERWSAFIRQAHINVE
jgi:tripartite-type tricarboxylate transporter receptor subunit TctC